MEHRLPRPHQSGFGEPLHAYVRVAVNGWRPEPQEGRLEQELHPASLLYQPCTYIFPLPISTTDEDFCSQTVLFLFCALNELFFIALYLLSFSSPRLSPSLLATDSSGSATSAQPGSPAHPRLLLNPWSAGALELARANKMDSRVPWILVGISAPVMVGKQIINVIQLMKASRWLAEGDVARRKEAFERELGKKRG